jgi:hypothetical protein
MRAGALRVATLMAILAVGDSTRAESPATLPAVVTRALEENSRGLQPVTVSWHEQITTPWEPKRDSWKQVTWQDGRLYARCKESHGVRDIETEFAFDRHILYTLEKPLLNKELAESVTRQLIFGKSYFDLVGVTIPVKGADLVAQRASCTIRLLLESHFIESIDELNYEGMKRLRVRIISENEAHTTAMSEDPDMLAARVSRWPNVTKQTVRLATDAQIGMRAMPPRIRQTIYLAPEHGYALTQSDDQYEDGTLLRRRVNSDFVQLEGRNVWLPRTCVDHVYWIADSAHGFQMSQAPLWTQTITVSYLSGNVNPDAKFVLTYSQPGAWVADATEPNAPQQLYYVPVPMHNLELVHWYRRPRVLWLAANVVSIVGVIIYYLRRRMGRHGAR